MVPNTAARLFTHTKSLQHITPVLHERHWLPFSQLVNYKILLLTYKALQQLTSTTFFSPTNPHAYSVSLQQASLPFLSPSSRSSATGPSPGLHQGSGTLSHQEWWSRRGWLPFHGLLTNCAVLLFILRFVTYFFICFVHNVAATVSYAQK